MPGGEVNSPPGLKGSAGSRRFLGFSSFDLVPFTRNRPGRRMNEIPRVPTDHCTERREWDSGCLLPPPRSAPMSSPLSLAHALGDTGECPATHAQGWKNFSFTLPKRLLIRHNVTTIGNPGRNRDQGNVTKRYRTHEAAHARFAQETGRPLEHPKLGEMGKQTGVSKGRQRSPLPVLGQFFVVASFRSIPILRPEMHRFGCVVGCVG